MKSIDVIKKHYLESESVITIGTFDGVHKGHELVFEHIKNYSELNIDNENKKIAIITPDKDIIPNAQTLSPAYIVFENYEIILKWNRPLRFALAVCTLKDKFRNEI